MNNVEKIKERLNIVDVVGSYLKLEKAGLNLKACCPFHNEKTPSFFISPERGTYKCFGCGEGGDIFSFVEKFEGVDFKGALKILAEKAGIELKKENLKITGEKNTLYDILEKTTGFFEERLKNNKLALEYLTKRGIKSETIQQFRLGFAEDEWRSLSDFLKQGGFGDNEIEKAGLIKKTERSFYDRFRNRIIFPLFDNSGQPVAFSGRFFENNNKLSEQSAEHKITSHYEQAKYLNSPETLLFSKSNILYGYNFAKSLIRKRNFSILVEGQMDLLMCHQAGYGNAVASSGTALSIGHTKLLKRLSNRMVIAFDGDEAGFMSACRATKLALAEGMEVRLMEIPKNLDPADLILKDEVGWQKSLKNAKHIIDFYLDKLVAEIKDKRKLGKEAQDRVLPFVALVNSEIEKAAFVEDISNKLGVPDKAIWVELRKIQIEFPKNIKDNKDVLERPVRSADLWKNASRKQNILKQIAGIYWWQKGAKLPLIDFQIIEKDFTNEFGAELLEKIKKISEKIKNEIMFETEILYENTDLIIQQKGKFVKQIDWSTKRNCESDGWIQKDESEQLLIEKNNLMKQLKELFINLKIELLDEEKIKIMVEQKKADKEGNVADALEKLKIYNELSKKKNDLVS